MIDQTDEAKKRLDAAISGVEREKRALEVAHGPLVFTKLIYWQLSFAAIRGRAFRLGVFSRLRHAVKVTQYALLPSTYKGGKTND